MLLYLLWLFTSVTICYGTLNSSRKKQIKLMTIFMIALGLFVGLSDMLGGYDRYIYADLFDSMVDERLMGVNPWNSYAFDFYGSEFGYGSYCALLSYVTANRYIFILMTTILIYVLLIVSMRQYVSNAPFAVILFLGLWFFFTFTYLRQVIGCTICWLSVRYIIERKPLPFFVLWFIAFSFHNSVIIFLPMYFLPIKKFSPQRILIVMGVSLLIGLTPIPQSLFSTYAELDVGRAGVQTYENVKGFRVAYLLEAAFFLYIILSNYKKIPENSKNIVLLNIALIFCAILLIFIRSENGGRVAWVFMIGILCIVSDLCISNRNINQYGILLICVVFFLYLRIYNAWQVANQLYPYKTFLTKGHRSPDLIWENYEYDDRYDENKFYRPAFLLFK